MCDCGSYQCAGKRQPSVAYGRVPAVDEFDLSAKWHDHAYATGMDRKKADYLFYKWNIGKGVKRTMAALAVGAQGYFRSSKKNNKLMPAIKRKRGDSNVSTTSKGSTSMPSKKRKVSVALRRRVRKGKKPYTVKGKIGKRITKRKVKKSKFDAGVSTALEFGSSISSGASVYIGHSTSPAKPIYRTLLSAVIKKFMMLGNFEVNDFDAPVRYGNAGDQFKLTYRNNQDGAFQSWDYITGAGWSIQQVIDEYTVVLTQGLHAQGQLELLILEYWPFHYDKNAWRPLISMDLKQVRVEMEVVSELKMQNRSVSDSGSASTDVINSNPLIGRLYAGNGSGTATVSNVALAAGSIGFYADGERGLIALEGTPRFLKEPPMPKDFTQVKYSKKLGINPGDVRTHVLVARHNMYINSYIRAYQGNPANLLGEANNKLGKFCFFGLERILYDGNESNPISVAFEIDLKIKARAYPTVTTKSTTINTVVS